MASTRILVLTNQYSHGPISDFGGGSLGESGTYQCHAIRSFDFSPQLRYSRQEEHAATLMDLKAKAAWYIGGLGPGGLDS